MYERNFPRHNNFRKVRKTPHQIKKRGGDIMDKKFMEKILDNQDTFYNQLEGLAEDLSDIISLLQQILVEISNKN